MIDPRTRAELHDGWLSNGRLWARNAAGCVLGFAASVGLTVLAVYEKDTLFAAIMAAHALVFAAIFARCCAGVIRCRRRAGKLKP